MRKRFTLLLCLVTVLAFAKPKREYYKLIVYHFSSAQQEQKLDQFLSETYLPQLHQSGFTKIGVFKPIANDTAKDKQLIILLNHYNLEKLSQPVQWGLTELGSYNQPIYNRYEQFLLSAFNDMPFMKIPDAAISKTDRIFELRSYESPTEAAYRNKVHMFNEGGEVKLFDQLGFNAVFYADVLFGSKMPNLMYMTSFSSIESRNEHWKQFGESATWKRLSSMDFYKNNMSALHSQLLKSTTYSDY